MMKNIDESEELFSNLAPLDESDRSCPTSLQNNAMNQLAA